MLTAAAGAAIEAARHGCVQAVLLVNQFAALDPDGVFDVPADSTLGIDVTRFASALGWAEAVEDGTLAGPFGVPAAPSRPALHSQADERIRLNQPAQKEEASWRAPRHHASLSVVTRMDSGCEPVTNSRIVGCYRHHRGKTRRRSPIDRVVQRAQLTAMAMSLLLATRSRYRRSALTREFSCPLWYFSMLRSSLSTSDNFS